jgi:putative cardiolipin synthase
MRIGSSSASLHTKAAIVDGDRVFIGSFNLDPRSAELNCEMGVWIRSESLADELRVTLDSALSPQNSFEVTLTPGGGLLWSEIVDGRPVVHRRDPYASLLRRVVTRVLGWLPIESQL